MRIATSLLIVAGCSNSLPPPGMCDVSTGGDTPVAEPVALGAGGYYDDLAFSRPRRQIVAAPEGAGRVSLVDVDSKQITAIAVPQGVGSADASATTLFAADRSAMRILAYDVATATMSASHALTSEPDYLRVSPTTGEVWVTLPGKNRIDILEPDGLAVVGSVSTPAPPEGLTFDAEGRAYTNNDGAVVAIDVARRTIVGEWNDGCGYSHGFPQVDLGYDLAFGGCRPNGGVGVTTTSGEQRAGFEAGGGPAVLAYDATRHHLYLRGDPSPMLYILAVCSTGELGTLATVAIPEHGHASAADDRGAVWIGDSSTGGLVRVVDPFAETM
jgi:hypothetical protein